MPTRADTISGLPSRDTRANGGDPTDYLVTRDDGETAAHYVVLREHVGEADTTGLDLNEQLTRAGKLELGLLDGKGLALCLEDSAPVGFWERHLRGYWSC